MGLFKSKAQKEQERKMLVKKSMRELEKRIQKLKEQEKVYVDAFKIAQREGLPDQVKLATDALRMTKSEEKRTYKMLLNARIISQMKDMSEMTVEFLQAVRVISKDIASSTTADVGKISEDLKMAIDKVSEQTENLGEMLEDAQEGVGDFSEDSSLTTDDEINKILYGASAGSADPLDAELDALKRQLNS